MDEVKNIAERLNYHAQDIGTELDDQKKLFTQVNKEMDSTNEKMKGVLDKLGKLL